MESHEQIIVKPYLGDIKADFFLLKLFDLLHKVKCLKLIKYNKSIQNRLNKGIKDFIEYTEIYSPIEIEIIPAKKNMVNLFKSLIMKKNLIFIYFLIMIKMK